MLPLAAQQLLARLNLEELAGLMGALIRHLPALFAAMAILLIAWTLATWIHRFIPRGHEWISAAPPPKPGGSLTAGPASGVEVTVL